LTNETKLRIHYITANVAVKFCIETGAEVKRRTETGNSTNEIVKTFIRHY
jgi:hypothetical protein